jgi:hypothetical protein
MALRELNLGRTKSWYEPELRPKLVEAIRKHYPGVLPDKK